MIPPTARLHGATVKDGTGVTHRIERGWDWGREGIDFETACGLEGTRGPIDRRKLRTLRRRIVDCMVCLVESGRT